MQPIDQYMMARTAELTGKVLRWYDEMEFHRVYHAINEFCASDLSATYLDVLKDRMYIFAPGDPDADPRKRRSGGSQMRWSA